MSDYPSENEEYVKQPVLSPKIVTKDDRIVDVYDDSGNAKTVLSVPSNSGESSPVSLQHPLPTDGDSVYCKDIWPENSITAGWLDADGTGEELVCIPFTNLHTAIINDTSDNPKVLRVHFNRTVFFNQVGIGCAAHPGENFSNVLVKVLGSGGVDRSVLDDSGNDDKLTSRNYQFGPELGNAIQLEFHTEDPVCISNITIQKFSGVSSILRAKKPDGVLVDIDATQGGNLKASVEELESQISEDANSTLRVAPILMDEFGAIARMLGDNLFQGAPVVITSEHHEIHCGDSYEATYTEDLGNGASNELLIIVPDEPGSGQELKLYHLVNLLQSQGEASFQLFEDATYSAAGTPIVSVNRNRQAPLSDFLGISHSPTLTTDGTPIWGPWVVGSGRAIGGDASRNREFVLKNNTVYMLRFINLTTTPNRINVELDYYVHPGV